MSKSIEACLVCGKPLKFYETAQKMKCVYCGKVFESNASCEDAHYVCDGCHSAKGIDSIIDYCMKSKSKNPIDMLLDMMREPYIYMHGNEHHIMVGASLITAYKNAGGEVDLAEALLEMKKRGSRYPGGSCGFWGCCGAAVSTGMFFSIVTKTTPLSGKTWGDGNLMTSKALAKIGEIGGPRCCKRNSFTAVISAVEYVRENLGIEMELPDRIKCEHSARNKQCIGIRCPYHLDTKENNIH